MGAKKSKGWRSGKREVRPRMVQMTRHLVVTEGKETVPRFFCNKTACRGSTRQGSGRLISVLPRTSEIARRKYAANSGNPEHAALFA